MKEVTSSIQSNAKVLFAAQMVTWASSFVLTMFLPRYLGAEAYGRLYFAISLTALGGLVIDLGLGSFFVKEVARDRSIVNRFFMDSAGLRIVSWFVAMAGMFLYVLTSGMSSETLTILSILGFGKLLETISDLAHRIFQSFERLSYRSIAVVIERVTLAAIAIAMLLSGYGVVTIALVMTLSVLLNFLTSLFFLPKLVHLKLRFQPSTWMSLIRGALPFLISMFFSFVYFRIDVVMLSAMTSDRVVGWYGAPYKLFDTLMFFPAILHMAVFPVFSRLWKESLEHFVQTARQVLHVSVIVGVPIAFLLVALARPIIGLLFGFEHYENSVILLQGLALCLPLVYANFVIGTVDTSSDKQKELSVVSIIAAVVNIGLNFWMIPFFQQSHGNGAIGATIATLITEACVTVMIISLAPPGCFGRENIAVAAKSVCAGAIAGVLLWYIEDHLNIWYVSGMIGLAIYTGLVVAARALTKREWDVLMGFLPLRRTPNPSQQPALRVYDP